MGKACLILRYSLLLIVLLFPAFLNCWSNSVSQQVEESYDTLKLGEQLFLGANHHKNLSSCVNCHNIKASDTFSWYPTAHEIAANYADKDLSAYEEVLLYGMSEQMYTSHEGAAEYTEKEFQAIKAYLQKINKEPLKERHPLFVKLVLLIFCLSAIFLIIADKFYFKIVKKKYSHRLLLLFIITFIIIFIYNDFISFGLQPGYEPDQPIKFSHYVHSKQNGTSCIYCHPAARYSASAGVSGTSVCMNCHSLVREGTHSGEYEIKKLIFAYENNIPIQWIRINNLPEHVKFNHAIHYSVGKIDCAECHGVVDEMDRFKQVNVLSMGWCLDCHKTRKIQFINNLYYSKYASLVGEINGGQRDSVFVKDIGGWDCMNCHY